MNKMHRILLKFMYKLSEYIFSFLGLVLHVNFSEYAFGGR